MIGRWWRGTDEESDYSERFAFYGDGLIPRRVAGYQAKLKAGGFECIESPTEIASAVGFREVADRNRQMTLILSLAAIVAAFWVVVSLYHSVSEPHLPVGTLASFSDDDGKTWFADDASKLPPFDHNGKQAFRALNYRCGEGTFFVACLESFPRTVKTRIQQAGGSDLLSLQRAQFSAASEMLIKAPGADMDQRPSRKRCKIHSDAQQPQMPQRIGDDPNYRFPPGGPLLRWPKIQRRSADLTDRQL